ncbi:MAG: hypothetical protein NTY53_00170 [Kiritimatiellaeota bacterium]|nr:hypothetical protein [Kiritimatiellota bacterium]
MTASLQSSLLLRYRLVLGFFIVALLVSGLTAFPLQFELDTLVAWFGWSQLAPASAPNGLAFWLLTVRDGLQETYAKFPWFAYGTDWLAFGHITIAIFFIGPLVRPVRNVWVLWAGLIACVLVPVLALACGPLRGIPFYWRLIDCSFGVLGALPLLYCLKLTRALEKLPPS